MNRRSDPRSGFGASSPTRRWPKRSVRVPPSMRSAWCAAASIAWRRSEHALRGERSGRIRVARPNAFAARRSLVLFYNEGDGRAKVLGGRVRRTDRRAGRATAARAPVAVRAPVPARVPAAATAGPGTGWAGLGGAGRGARGVVRGAKCPRCGTLQSGFQRSTLKRKPFPRSASGPRRSPARGLPAGRACEPSRRRPRWGRAGRTPARRSYRRSAATRTWRAPVWRA